MIEEFATVLIKGTNLTGTVVDISESNGRKNYIVECDTEDAPNGYGPENRLVDCTAEELELV